MNFFIISIILITEKNNSASTTIKDSHIKLEYSNF